MGLPLGMIDAIQICVRPNTARYNITLTELPTSNQRKHNYKHFEVSLA